MNWRRRIAFPKAEDRVISACDTINQSSLISADLNGRALKVRWLVVAASGLILFSSYMMLKTNLIGSEYAPAEDDGNFSVSVTMPPGTSLTGTDAVVRRVEAGLKNIPEVENIFTSVGGGGGFGGGGSRSGNISIQLKDKHHRERSVFQVLADVPPHRPIGP